MYIRKINEDSLRVAIPLTATSGKIRIKKRTMLNEYGVPVATCQVPFSQSCYVEWQIGYDVPVKDPEKLKLSTLAGLRFVGANGKEKALYELSEYVFYCVKWGFIPQQRLCKLAEDLLKLKRGELFDAHPDMAIRRRNFVEQEINGVLFWATTLEYPLIVRKLGAFEVFAEIITREKQRAVGVQPMLYLCFPVMELHTEECLIGRTAKSKECADFVIGRENADVFLEILKLFGMLSENHRQDVLSIINIILEKKNV